MSYPKKLGVAAIFVLISMVSGRGSAEEASPPDDSRVSQAREHARQARVHYQLGRFEQALEEYAAAYELDPVPALLYNMGQCHRQLDSYERAIFFYEGYLRGNPDAQNRSLVEELIAECRTALEQEQAAAESAEEISEEHAGDSHGIAEGDDAIDQGAQDHAGIGASEGAGENEPSVARERRPIYRQWWFWTAIGSVLAVSTALILWAALREPDAPQGSLGTVDWRD